MIIGITSKFAIESEIAEAYDRRSLLAFGFFVIHVGGYVYGVRSSDATFLANSLDVVELRIQNRGRHSAAFADTADAGEIADAFRYAFHAEEDVDVNLLGIRRSELRQLMISNNLVRAPDGDAAFDDGSHVLQFDIGDYVRLIGYTLRASNGDFCHDSATLRDQRMSADEFYGTLQKWRDAFIAEWTIAPKQPYINTFED